MDPNTGGDGRVAAVAVWWQVCASRKDDDPDDYLRLPQLGRGMKDRQKSWLNRHSGAAPTSWRPIKLHRLSARAWCRNVDNAFRIGTGHAGLAFFDPQDYTKPPWNSWESFRFAAIGMDFGSDGNCVAHAMTYHFKLAVERMPDQSHINNRVVYNSLKEVGLYPLVLLLVVGWNLLHGPDKEDTRWHQVREGLGDMYARSQWYDVPLFVSMAPRIIASLRQMGVDFGPAEAPEAVAWSWMRKRAAFLRQGSHTVLSRFQAIAAGLKTHMPFWPIELYERTAVDLEEDFLVGKKFLQKFVARPGRTDVVEEGGGTTSSAALTMESRAFRSCCQNSVVVSVMTLSEDDNERYGWMMLRVCEPVMVHSNLQVTMCTSADGCEKWITQQAAGGYISFVREVLIRLWDFASVEASGLVCNLAQRNTIMGHTPNEASTEDDFANVYGQLVVHTASQALKRGRWLLRGYPWSLCRALLLSDVGLSAVLADFRRDAEVFERFKNADLGRHGMKLLSRHLLTKVSSVQLLRALEDPAAGGAQWLASVRRVLQARARVAVPSKVIEDAIGAMKNIVIPKQANRLRRPERSMGIVLKRRVLYDRHMWAEVPRGVATGAQMKSSNHRRGGR